MRPSERLPTVSPALLVARLREGSVWSIALAPEQRIDDAVTQLREEAEAQEVPLLVVFAEGDLEETIARLVEGPGALTLLVFSGALSEDTPRLLDALRSRLPTDRPVIVVMSRPSAERLLSGSHHFESLVQQVEELDLDTPVLSVTETQARLAALARATGLTDDEVLAQARAGRLPPDPDFAEWLVLLGHGELLDAP